MAKKTITVEAEVCWYTFNLNYDYNNDKSTDFYVCIEDISENHARERAIKIINLLEKNIDNEYIWKFEEKHESPKICHINIDNTLELAKCFFIGNIDLTIIPLDGEHKNIIYYKKDLKKIIWKAAEKIWGCTCHQYSGLDCKPIKYDKTNSYDYIYDITGNRGIPFKSNQIGYSFHENCNLIAFISESKNEVEKAINDLNSFLELADKIAKEAYDKILQLPQIENIPENIVEQLKKFYKPNLLSSNNRKTTK